MRAGPMTGPLHAGVVQTWGSLGAAAPVGAGAIDKRGGLILGRGPGNVICSPTG
jgi:hypothetical protein